jgi:tetrahydromethanopterin S-methyltransferase subunit G
MTVAANDRWMTMAESGPTQKQIVEGTRGIWQVIVDIEKNTKVLLQDTHDLKDGLDDQGRRLLILDRSLRNHDKRFDAIDKTFENMRTDIDQRFSGVDQRFDQADERMDEMSTKLDLLIDIVKKPTGQET